MPPTPFLQASLDGYTDLPPGKLANVVTFLERTEPPAIPPALPPGLRVRHLAPNDLDGFRALYRRIGGPWLWFSALTLTDEALAARLSGQHATALVLERAGQDIGLVELAREPNGGVEIVSFGLVPEAIGSGAARPLMDVALDEAFGGGARRVWLHTCNFDHPAALAFYRRSGFSVWKLAIEICDDPRRLGILPLDAAPDIPLAPLG